MRKLAKILAAFAIVFGSLSMGIEYFGEKKKNPPKPSPTTKSSLREALQSETPILYLDLSSQGLQKLPSALGERTELRELDLSGNSLQRLPLTLNKLKNLEKLDVSDNPDIDLYNVISIASGLPNLKELNLSYCNLTAIPANIKRLKGLEILNLSYNYLVLLPDEMTMLRHLKRIDLSHNALQKLDWCPNFWWELRSIDVSGNARLDHESFFEAISYSEKIDELKVSDMQVVPKNLSELRVKHITFEDCNFKKLRNADDWYGIKTLTLSNCSELASRKCSRELREIPHIDKLIIRGGLDGEVNFLTALNNIDTLDVLGNNIDGRTLDQLDRRMNKCHVIKEAVNDFVAYQGVQKPIPGVDPRTMEYTVDASDGMKIRTTNAKIDIPRNAFVDKNGNIVNGKVDVKYQEMTDPVDIMLSGIPMTMDVDGKKEQFKSNGMINFTASVEGEEVYANPDAQVEITMMSRNVESGYNTYYFDEETGEWEETGQPDVDVIDTDASFESLMREQGIISSMEQNTTRMPKGVDFDDITAMSNNPRLQALFSTASLGDMPRKYYEKIVPNTKYDSKERTFEISFEQLPLSRNKGDFFYSFDDIDRMSRYRLMYKGFDAKEAYHRYKDLFRAMKKIYRKQAFRNRYRTLTYSAKSPTFIRDIRIVPHPEQDDYLVKIMYRDSLIEIPVYLQERSPLPDRVVKNNANFVKRYVSRLKRRERDWVRTNVDYDRALDEWREGYEALAQAARTGIIDVRQGMTFTRPLQQQGFAIFPFGTHNVDQFISFPATDSKMLAYSLKGEGKVKPRRVYLIDYTNQSVAFYRPNRKLVYSKYSSYALVALLDGNKVGYLRQEDFDRQVRSFGRKVELSAMDVGDISPQNLSKIFSS